MAAALGETGPERSSKRFSSPAPMAHAPPNADAAHDATRFRAAAESDAINLMHSSSAERSAGAGAGERVAAAATATGECPAAFGPLAFGPGVPPLAGQSR